MSKLKWDETGKRLYETGVDHGVLYPIQNDGKYSKGTAWNGLTAVTESPSGADANPLYQVPEPDRGRGLRCDHRGLHLPR